MVYDRLFFGEHRRRDIKESRSNTGKRKKDYKLIFAGGKTPAHKTSVRGVGLSPRPLIFSLIIPS